MKSKVYSSVEQFKEQNAELKTDLPISDDNSVLCQKVKIGNLELSNRLVCQAMEGCDGTADGRPDELTVRRYERLSKGGAGLIWFEATAVCNEGRANPRQLYINEKNLDDFKKIVENIKQRGMKENGYEPAVIMQATHSGRYSKPEGKPAPIIAYNNPIFEKDNPIDKSRIITDEGLDRVHESLVHAAGLAKEAGFDGVDIKCCHRYLNSELLSAFTREGRYGGSFENRTRLLRESVRDSISLCGDGFTVTSRMNVYDGFPYPYGFGVKEGEGITPDFSEADRLIKELAELGVKLLDITMGNPYFNPHVNRPYAAGGYEPPEHPLCGVARMLKGTAKLGKANPDVSLICSGLSFLGAAAPGVAAAFIEEGGFSLAGFGRMIFAYPDFAKDIVNGRFDPKKICITCSKCTEIMRAGGTPGCIVRDGKTYMPIYKKYCK
jgi:2,4-dienoyl-CoA reductase-like NADH-dependent reductase (Old Yellow Enzyme family)